MPVAIYKKPQYCQICVRQFVSNPSDKEQTCSQIGAIAMVGGAICAECGEDLDENGLFPGEYGYKEN